MKYVLPLLVLILLTACQEDEVNPYETNPGPVIRAVDLSILPEIEESGTVFYNFEGQAENMLSILKNAGVNTVRLRLWHTPDTKHSSLQEVQQFSNRLKENKLNVWLTIHYSDTWADPGSQDVPKAWESLQMGTLADSVFRYTEKVIKRVQPDFVQIGNEINNGFLFPHGNIYSNASGFEALYKEGARAVRETSEETMIIFHYAGLDGAETFFNRFPHLDFDVIGLSYYPIWHGKDLDELSNTLSTLGEVHNKPVIIAEVAYPFTLGWADWTNNIVGLEEQLILPDYPASPDGQKSFISRIMEIATARENGLGICYWGGEWVAFKGPQAMDGSPFENQALFDFEFRALPVVEVFRE